VRTSLTTTPTSSQDSSTSKTYYTNDLPVPHRCQERIDLNKKNEKENQHYENCLFKNCFVENLKLFILNIKIIS
jgi:hypothetical protein